MYEVPHALACGWFPVPEAHRVRLPGQTGQGGVAGVRQRRESEEIPQKLLEMVHNQVVPGPL